MALPCPPGAWSLILPRHFGSSDFGCSSAPAQSSDPFAFVEHTEGSPAVVSLRVTNPARALGRATLPNLIPRSTPPQTEPALLVTGKAN